MSRGNLIPASRVQRRSVMRRWRLWISVWSIALILAISALGLAWAGQQTPDTQQELTAMEHELASIRGEILAVRGESARLREQTAGARIVRHHPDWGILLDALAASRDEAIHLHRLRIESSQEGAGIDPLDRARLDLEGVAQDAPSVSEYAVRLEATGLFRQVLIDEARRDDPANPRVRFRILTLMEQGGGDG